MRRTERAAYRTKFYSNLSSPTRFDEEPFSSGSAYYFFLPPKASFILSKNPSGCCSLVTWPLAFA
ncbi:hypothetical protein EGX24_07585 [Enterococcus gallinarum]|nr:hypothetical protein EGW90_07575 [Enterococcus gallinarum]ROZ04931.1 hypothetical protein EGX16_11870 [Enterococcus gallinarum]ROZ11355.1 hypothetical protein EGX22_11880 [Enterococcus gallinarum]ROZ33564.1 hypothetical protein EGX24_07585 [Enterococcus gallinarum]